MRKLLEKDSWLVGSPDRFTAAMTVSSPLFSMSVLSLLSLVSGSCCCCSLDLHLFLQQVLERGSFVHVALGEGLDALLERAKAGIDEALGNLEHLVLLGSLDNLNLEGDGLAKGVAAGSKEGQLDRVRLR